MLCFILWPPQHPYPDPHFARVVEPGFGYNELSRDDNPYLVHSASTRSLSPSRSLRALLKPDADAGAAAAAGGAAQGAAGGGTSNTMGARRLPPQKQQRREQGPQRQRR